MGVIFLHRYCQTKQLLQPDKIVCFWRLDSIGRNTGGFQVLDCPGPKPSKLGASKHNTVLYLFPRSRATRNLHRTDWAPLRSSLQGGVEAAEKLLGKDDLFDPEDGTGHSAAMG